MSRDLHTAASITPPISGSDDMLRLASSATASRFRIPDSWLHSHVTVQLEGVSGHVAFTKDITLVLDGTDVSTLDGSFDISGHGTAEGAHIPTNGGLRFDLSRLPRLQGGESWYLAHVESAGTGYFEVRRTSGGGKL